MSDFPLVLLSAVVATVAGFHCGWRSRGRADAKAVLLVIGRLQDDALSTEARHELQRSIRLLEVLIQP